MIILYQINETGGFMVEKNINIDQNDNDYYIKLENERESTVVEFDVDISDKLYDKLYKVGLDVIVKDREAIINYAVKYLLTKYMDKVSMVNDDLSNCIKAKQKITRVCDKNSIKKAKKLIDDTLKNIE